MKVWTTLPVSAETTIINVSAQECRSALKKSFGSGLPLSALPIETQEKLNKGERVLLSDIFAVEAISSQ
jgi:hypothetical protein